MSAAGETIHLLVATGDPDTCKGLCGVTEATFTGGVEGTTCHACRLRYWRKGEGLNRKDAAQALGVSVRTIEKWEIGRGRVPLPIWKLTEALRALNLVNGPW